MTGHRTNEIVKPRPSSLLGLVRLLDSVAIAIILGLCVALYGIGWTHAYSILGLLAILLFSFFSEYCDIYGNSDACSVPDIGFRVLGAWALTAAALLVIGFAAHVTADFSRVTVSMWGIAAPLGIISLHAIQQVFFRLVRSSGHGTQAVAIVGANELGQRLERAISNTPSLGYRLYGYYDDREKNRENSPPSTSVAPIGTFGDLCKDAKAGKFEIVYITLPLGAEQRIKTLIGQLADTTASVYFIPNVFAFDLLYARWNTLRGLPVISIFESPFFMIESVAKRIEDIALCLIVLPIIIFPMALLAAGVKLSSPGPIIFKQRRYGVRGESIVVWKFRTMSVCEDGDTIRQATDNDPRITPFGAFLRSTSLDELPQFFNVLGGDMSIIGPRPHAIAHNEYYRARIPGYMLRHKVKPGITGLAQISGYRGETDTIDKMEARVRCDLDYIRQWSLFLDARILITTVVKMLNNQL